MGSIFARFWKELEFSDIFNPVEALVSLSSNKALNLFNGTNGWDIVKGSAFIDL